MRHNVTRCLWDCCRKFGQAQTVVNALQNRLNSFTIAKKNIQVTIESLCRKIFKVIWCVLFVILRVLFVKNYAPSPRRSVRSRLLIRMKRSQRTLCDGPGTNLFWLTSIGGYRRKLKDMNEWKCSSSKSNSDEIRILNATLQWPFPKVFASAKDLNHQNHATNKNKHRSIQRQNLRCASPNIIDGNVLPSMKRYSPIGEKSKLPLKSASPAITLNP